MARFPNPVGPWIAAEAEPGSERPDTDHLAQLSACGSNACRHRVGVVQDQDRSRWKRRRETGAEVESFELRQIRRFLDQSGANDSGDANADRFDPFISGRLLDLAHQPFGIALRRRLGRRTVITDGAYHLALLHDANRDVLARSNPDCPHIKTCSAY